MKTTMKVTLAALVVGVSTLMVNAQDASGTPGNDSARSPGMNGHRPPPSPLVMAVDANHDGVIDADEITNASAALKALDKNSDGKLTRDEFCPPPPNRGGNPPDGAPQGPPSGDQ
jgi:hypothetical protein